jgi:hypothetical protein
MARKGKKAKKKNLKKSKKAKEFSWRECQKPPRAQGNVTVNSLSPWPTFPPLPNPTYFPSLSPLISLRLDLLSTSAFDISFAFRFTPAPRTKEAPRLSNGVTTVSPELHHCEI